MGPAPRGVGYPVSALAKEFAIMGYPPVRPADRGSRNKALTFAAKKGNRNPYHALAGNNGTLFLRPDRPFLEAKRTLRKVFV